MLKNLSEKIYGLLKMSPNTWGEISLSQESKYFIWSRAGDFFGGYAGKSYEYAKPREYLY